MRARARWLAISLAAGGVACSVVAWTRPGCELLGFKWASVRGRCYTPLCALSDCGRWANNAQRCAQVAVGDRVAWLRYQLGEAESEDRGVAVYPRGKDDGHIRVGISGGHVTAVDCHAP